MIKKTVYKKEARAPYLDTTGAVDWDKVVARYAELKKIKESLGNKHFDVVWARSLFQTDQHRLLDIMVGGLANDDASVGVYATRPEDYVDFKDYLVPIIREYHGIIGDVKQMHDWNIPTGAYLLNKLNPSLGQVSMRARVARNVDGWNLPSSMNIDERLNFERYISKKIFAKLPFKGKYYSLALDLSVEEIKKMREDHYLFNDMTTDNHLTTSGIASDWPYGRGIWFSEDRQKMIWVGEEDHLRIISIVHGTDLGAVDKSLSDLLTAIEELGVSFAKHETYGIITTCPTNIGTGKRQSVLIQLPNLSKKGTDEKNLKTIAKSLGLQARGLSGEHSTMDAAGTTDISPLARFGVTEAEVTKRLYEGLVELIKKEKGEN